VTSAPRWLAILGIGEDGVEGLAPAARALLGGAQVVYGGERHLALAAPLIAGEARAWPRPLSDALPALAALRPAPVAVLASGDPYCFGVGATLAKVVPAEETICIPSPSAFSLTCARLGWSLPDVATVSLCGRRIETLIPHLQPDARVLVLSADARTPGEVAGLLRARGFGTSDVHVLEALGGPRERIRVMRADAEMPDDIDPLNMLALDLRAGPDARVLPLSCGLPDEFFDSDGQLTKQEIRAVTLAALAPYQGALLWDIGLGSGSVAIEWLLRHPANRAAGVEANAERAARAAGNAAALGVPRLRIVRGHAPDTLPDGPAPDAVFLGGGVQAPGMIETLWAKLRPGGRMVANAVTIESEARLFAAHAAHGGTLRRIGVERIDAVGSMRAFRPAMTVTQWAADKP
jgi:precorrin-6B C5,15-methyltransferase / cobalt-precorrin-6B C5,C15-methyltransferase